MVTARFVTIFISRWRFDCDIGNTDLGLRYGLGPALAPELLHLRVVADLHRTDLHGTRRPALNSGLKFCTVFAQIVVPNFSCRCGRVI